MALIEEILEKLEELYKDIKENKSKFFILPALYCLTKIEKEKYIYIDTNLKKDFSKKIKNLIENNKLDIKIDEENILTEMYKKYFNDDLNDHIYSYNENSKFNTSMGFSQWFREGKEKNSLVQPLLADYIEYIGESEINELKNGKDTGDKKPLYRIKPNHYDNFAETIKKFVEVSIDGTEKISINEKISQMIHEDISNKNKKNDTTSKTGQNNGGTSEPSISSVSLNQILYGSPGTGKTYNTINKALEIIFQDKLTKEDYENGKVKEEKLEELSQNELSEEEKKDIATDSRKLLKACFEKYKNAGQIEFVTFHQSYGYEEFVEGIKAETNEKTKQIEYKIEAGIFKKLCAKASTKADINSLDFGNPNKIWKMSLGESGSKQAKDIRQYCFDNNIIGLGFWISDVKFEGKNGNEIFEEMKKEHEKNPEQYLKNADSKIESANKTSRIVNEMQEGDIVLISGDNLKTISGIAKVTGEYKILSELKKDYPDIMVGYEQVREVEWLVKNIDISVDDYLEKGKQQLGRGTIISNNTINLEKLKKLEIKSNTDKNYILIIDEINRGNISKIFGELITLIEPSKRIGADEEIKVKLPYSGYDFGVPQNLYIIGTMNTADRSIAQIDTALRRRFHFKEMMPNPELLKDETEKDLEVDTINIKSLLEAINERIEYIYDREHQIGHSYFLPLKVNPTKDKLDEIFRVNIIPLLAEYFYGDWTDIKFVLNDTNHNFINIKEEKDLIFDMSESKKRKNKIYNVNKKEFSDEAYRNIYALKK